MGSPLQDGRPRRIGRPLITPAAPATADEPGRRQSGDRGAPPAPLGPAHRQGRRGRPPGHLDEEVCEASRGEIAKIKTNDLTGYWGGICTVSPARTQTHGGDRHATLPVSPLRW